ncbi:MAG: peptidoglycan DD-metalloendopeptidase family protein [Butyricicoccus pullicaecorum]|nr:peptidoglycan DD-metalloendopeptidase family protein [Butyricicoccus pullicaecorum]
MYHNKRNRIIAAIIAGILVVLMLGSTIFGALSMAAAASKSQLNNKLAEIKTQKAEVERQLAAYQKDKEAYAGQIGTLNNKINLTEQQIAATEEVIQELTRSIAETNEELAKAEEKLAEKQALFETRIRVMYENGETSYMEVLLNSDSFSDMLSNMEIVSQIMEYDKNVVTEVQQMRDSIEQMKEKLESDHKQQKEHKDSLEAGKHELEADKAKLKTMMEQVESNMDSARKLAAQMDAEREQINAEIAELSRREAEAARKRAQEEKRKAAQQNSSSSHTAVFSGGSMRWPCPNYSYISSEFGARVHPITGEWQSGHKGIDIASGKGNPILAAKSGTVVKSYLSSSYGNYVVVSHGGGLMTAYAHMSKRMVSVGDTVSAGQQIGTVGSTGNSTGNHLHFEVYVDGAVVNPMDYVSP